MNESIDPDNITDQIWHPPTFQEIPISFEATSYAAADDDPLYR